MIYILITAIVFYLLGYWAGKSTNLFGDIQTISQVVKSKLQPSMPTGIIKPPTAQDINLKNMPKEKREGIEAMRETLDNDPEMVKRRELLKKMIFNKEKGIYELQK